MNDSVKANRITVKGHRDTITYEKTDTQNPYVIRGKAVHHYENFERSYFITEKVKRRDLKRIINEIPIDVDIEMIIIDPVMISVETERSVM